MDTYGWKINNSEEVAQILDDLKAGKKVEREPVYAQTANSHGENDYGNSYVEINLTAQHLFLYKDGVLVTESRFCIRKCCKRACNTRRRIYAYL